MCKTLATEPISQRCGLNHTPENTIKSFMKKKSTVFNSLLPQFVYQLETKSDVSENGYLLMSDYYGFIFLFLQFINSLFLNNLLWFCLYIWDMGNAMTPYFQEFSEY